MGCGGPVEPGEVSPELLEPESDVEEPEAIDEQVDDTSLDRDADVERFDEQDEF